MGRAFFLSTHIFISVETPYSLYTHRSEYKAIKNTAVETLTSLVTHRSEYNTIKNIEVEMLYSLTKHRSATKCVAKILFCI